MREYRSGGGKSSERASVVVQARDDSGLTEVEVGGKRSNQICFRDRIKQDLVIVIKHK